MPESPHSPAEPNPPEPISLKELAARKGGALTPEDTVKTAGERMRAHDTHSWPVAEDLKLVGMVDDKNPDWQLGGRGHDPKSWSVGQIMSREIFFCYEDEDCASAQKVMDARDLKYLPVVDREMRIVGIFTREEIHRTLEAQAAHAAESKADPQP